MFCSNCGKQLPDGSRFCAECGAQLNVATSVARAPAAPANSNPFAEPGSVNLGGDYELEVSDRNPNAAALLALFFGILGIHDFYCGNTKNGAIKLIMSITGILAFISAIWNIIDMWSIGSGTYSDGDNYYLEAAPWIKWVLIIIYVVPLIVFLVCFLGALVLGKSLF